MITSEGGLNTMGTTIRESKHDRFIRVAEARTNKILTMIRLLGNCSSRSSYEYQDEYIQKIFGAIERETRMAKNRFICDKENSDRFSLK